MRHKSIATAIALALLLPAALALADPAPKQDSAQLKKLSAELWQKVLSIPASVNPLIDDSGADCMVGQDGSVWFLLGTSFGLAATTRSCMIPEGVSLYFPVVDAFNYNTPNICGQVGSLTVQQERALVKPGIDGATGLSVTVDGVPVKKLSRVQSDVFWVAQPADNLFLAACGGDSPAGVYSPGVDDGYYVLLKPLSVGSHTLHIMGTFPGPSTQDVTYHLTVVPVSTK